MLALALPLLAVQAEASAIAFSSPGIPPTNPLLVPGGSFAELGLTGTLNVDPTAVSTGIVNTAELVTGAGGVPFQYSGFDLSFFLTLDGVKNLLTQHAVWLSSPYGNGVFSFERSGTVQFDTVHFGSFNVALDPFFLPGGLASTVNAHVMADFTPVSAAPVPEPASIVLLATG